MRVALAGIIVNDGRVLLLQRAASPCGWELPSGLLQEGEDSLAGLRRAIQERCGLTVEPVAPFDVWMGTDDERTIGVSFLCRCSGGDVKLDVGYSATGWFTPTEATEQGLAVQPSVETLARAVRVLNLLAPAGTPTV